MKIRVLIAALGALAMAAAPSIASAKTVIIKRGGGHGWHHGWHGHHGGSKTVIIKRGGGHRY